MRPPTQSSSKSRQLTKAGVSKYYGPFPSNLFIESPTSRYLGFHAMTLIVAVVSVHGQNNLLLLEKHMSGLKAPIMDPAAYEFSKS
jgi:hypothetical protein